MKGDRYLTIRAAEHQLRMEFLELATLGLRLEPSAATDTHPYPHVVVSAGRHVEHTPVPTDASLKRMVSDLHAVVGRVLRAHAED